MTPQAVIQGASPRHPRTIIGVVLAFLGTIALSIGVSTGPVAGLDDTDFVPLSNSGADLRDDCPVSVGDAWNFVIVPNDGTYAFVTISLNLGGTIVDFDGSAIVSNGGQADNVFVSVPSGYSLSDLQTFGSEAEITPGGAYSSSGGVQFVLSYLCDGEESTTTTTVEETTTTVEETTTTVEETTTTVEETTTTVEETTTTEAETTTTVAEETTTTFEVEDSTTTSVEVAPPTTTGTGSNSPTTVLTQLPKTGPGTTDTMLVLGALLLLVGGAMVLSSRRDHGIA